MSGEGAAYPMWCLMLTLAWAWGLSRTGLVDALGLEMRLLGCHLFVVNLVFVPGLYWWDKRRARSGYGRRIPEAMLHGFAFAGGAMAALISQRVLRHKTRKVRFSVLTWIALASNMVLLYLGLQYLPSV